MSFKEVIRFALRGLSANKLRSALTMLGILIGVAAVILLVAVGNGSAKAISDRIEALGTNTITVMSAGRGGSSNTALTTDMATALTDRSLAPDIKSVSPVVSAVLDEPPRLVLITVMVLVPSASIRSLIALAEPLPTATSRITAATPIRMPSMVRAERSLFADRPRSAKRMTSRKLIRHAVLRRRQPAAD